MMLRKKAKKHIRDFPIVYLFVILWIIVWLKFLFDLNEKEYKPMTTKTTMTTIATTMAENYHSSLASKFFSSSSASSMFIQMAQMAYHDSQLYLKPTTRRTFPGLQAWSPFSTDGGLTDQDRILLAKYYRQATSVFEYGLGESTRMASWLQVPRYAGVDSDPNYVTKIRFLLQQQDETYASHAHFYFADVGDITEWGMPKDSLPKNVYNYQIVPLLAEQDPFDVYLVDGRYRVACVLAAMLHAGGGRGGGKQTNATVLLHDCFPPGYVAIDEIEQIQLDARRFYHVVDSLLTMIDHSGSKLCVYQRKPTTTDEQIYQLWKAYAADLS
jgi:hypothetical protein